MIEVQQHRLDGVDQLRTFTLHEDSELNCWYSQEDGFRFNHVIRANFGSGNSQQISNPIDRAVLKVIRSQANLIVTTGKTAVIENLKASKFAPMLVLTNQDEISFAALEEPSAMPVFVTCEAQGWRNPNAKAVGKTNGDLVTWLGNFCRNYPKVVLETGPSLIQPLAPLLNDVCITVVEADTLPEARDSAERFLDELGLSLKLMQILEMNGTFFLRFYTPQEK